MGFLETKRQRISVDKLTIGMFVAELDRPWADTPFLIQGFQLKNSQDIQAVQAVCDYVYIEVKIKRDEKGAIQYTQYVEKVSVGQALSDAIDIRKHAHTIVTDLYDSIRMGMSFKAEPLKKLVKDSVSNVIANPAAMQWLTLLKNKDDYTAEHSMNVCFLAIILGRAEGINEEQLENIGICGLLHDIGKAKIPIEILNKEGAFTPEEYDIMKTHPAHGRKLLMSRSDIYSGAVDAAYCHHERLDGNGYPRGVTGDKISYFSKIVAIVDAYDAITSTRVYSGAKSSLDALRILSRASGTHFDKELTQTFTESIGIFPPGSIAEMSSGEIGIVLPGKEENRKKPSILLVRNSDKQVCKEKVIHLSKNPVDSNGEPYQIRHLLSDNAFDIDLKAHHQRITELLLRT